MRMWLCDYKDCQGKLFPIHAFEQVSGVGWVHKVVPRHTKGGRLVSSTTTVPNLPMAKPYLDLTKLFPKSPTRPAAQRPRSPR